MPFGYRFHHHAHALGFPLLGPMLLLIVLGLCAWVAFSILRRTSHHPVPVGPPSVSRETPEELLDRRFASGEIDAEAHAAARQHLKDHPR